VVDRRAPYWFLIDTNPFFTIPGRNPSPRMTKVTVHEKQEVNEK